MISVEHLAQVKEGTREKGTIDILQRKKLKPKGLGGLFKVTA